MMEYRIVIHGRIELPKQIGQQPTDLHEVDAHVSLLALKVPREENKCNKADIVVRLGIRPVKLSRRVLDLD